METRAHHLLIGTFVLLLVAGMLGFAAWLAKVQVNRQFAYYRIYFEGSVTGLSRASDVRFNGVPVGTVAQIKVDPEDPQKVRVTIEIAADTPIRTDTVAQLEWQGLTGASFVQLLGGSAQTPILVYDPGGKPPTIAARRSVVQELVTAAPDLLQRGMQVADRLLAMLDDDNRAAFASMLRNADQLVGALAAKSDTAGRTFDNIESASAALRTSAVALDKLVARLDRLSNDAEKTLTAARGTMGKADGVLDRDLPALLREARETAKAFARMSEEMRAVVAENREAIGDFSTGGLLEFAKFVDEARNLVSALNRVTTRIESDPAQFLFGNSQRGYKPK